MDHDAHAWWDAKLIAVSIFYTHCVFRAIDTTIIYFENEKGDSATPWFLPRLLPWTTEEIYAAVVLATFLIWLATHFYRSLFRYFPESNPRIELQETRLEIWETTSRRPLRRMFGFMHLAVTLGLFYLLAWNLGPPNRLQAIIICWLFFWDLLLVISIPSRYGSRRNFSAIFHGKYTPKMELEAEKQSKPKPGEFSGDFYLSEPIHKRLPTLLPSHENITLLERLTRLRLYLINFFNPTSPSVPNVDFNARFHGKSKDQTTQFSLEARFEGNLYAVHTSRYWLIYPWRQDAESIQYWRIKNICVIATLCVCLLAYPDFPDRHPWLWCIVAFSTVVGAIPLHKKMEEGYQYLISNPPDQKKNQQTSLDKNKDSNYGR